MKKFYISICALLISFGAIAQVLNLEKMESDQQFDERKAFYQDPNITSSANSAVPIWEEDFSGGFPAGWSTYTSNTQGGFATCPWVYTLDGSWGYWNGSGQWYFCCCWNQLNNCF